MNGGWAPPRFRYVEEFVTVDCGVRCLADACFLKFVRPLLEFGALTRLCAGLVVLRFRPTAVQRVNSEAQNMYFRFEFESRDSGKRFRSLSVIEPTSHLSSQMPQNFPEAFCPPRLTSSVQSLTSDNLPVNSWRRVLSSCDSSWEAQRWEERFER